MGVRRLPHLLAFEPTPLDVRVVHRDFADGSAASAIYRVWATPHGRLCRLCPRADCTLEPIEARPELATCIVVVTGHLSPIEAATFRLDD